MALLIALVCAGLFTLLVFWADARDERIHKRQMARIIGTPEWFDADPSRRAMLRRKGS